MLVGVPKETAVGERRVALVPEVVRKLTGRGVEVVIEAGAGGEAVIPDQLYADVGATVSKADAKLWSAPVVVKVSPPSKTEIAKLKAGSTLIGFLDAAVERRHDEGARQGEGHGVRDGGDPTDLPRPGDGRAVLAEQRRRLPRGDSRRRADRPLLPDADDRRRHDPAGSRARPRCRRRRAPGARDRPPARRADAATTSARTSPNRSPHSAPTGSTSASRRAGEGGYARELTDAEKQVAQQQALTDAIKGFDVVITTALVPGRPAPRLVTAEAVKGMKPGSVIIDLAGETGGNCELTAPGKTTVKHDVKIVSPLNLAADMPEHASQLYARNILALLDLMLDEQGELALDFDDEIIAGACITRDGEIVNAAARTLVEGAK